MYFSIYFLQSFAAQDHKLLAGAQLWHKWIPASLRYVVMFVSLIAGSPLFVIFKDDAVTNDQIKM